MKSKIRCCLALILALTFAGRARDVFALDYVDQTTQGNWIGTYGGQGYILNSYIAGGGGTYNATASIGNDLSSLPSYVSSYSYSNASQYVWATGESSIRDLQNPFDPTGTRTAATSFSQGDWSMNLTLSHAADFQLAVYGLDWEGENGGRSISVTVGSQSLALNTSDGYYSPGGAYAVFDVNAPAGPLTISITNDANNGANATISGVFFDKIVSTPEPSSFILCALGTLGLVVVARRRKP